MSDTTASKPKRQSAKYITEAANKAKAAGYQTRDIRLLWRKPECVAYLKYGIWPAHLPPPVMAAHTITAALHPSDCEPLEDPAPPTVNRDSIRVRFVRFYFDDFFGDRRVHMLEPQCQSALKNDPPQACFLTHPPAVLFSC